MIKEIINKVKYGEIRGIINKRDTLPVTHLVFMDIDERKLNIVGSLCQRMITAAGLPCKTELVDDEYKLEIKESSALANSVKMMTIHASKGLQFPVVISFGGFKEPNTQGKVFTYHEKEEDNTRIKAKYWNTRNH